MTTIKVENATLFFDASLHPGDLRTTNLDNIWVKGYPVPIAYRPGYTVSGISFKLQKEGTCEYLSVGLQWSKPEKVVTFQDFWLSEGLWNPVTYAVIKALAKLP